MISVAKVPLRLAGPSAVHEVLNHRSGGMRPCRCSITMPRPLGRHGAGCVEGDHRPAGHGATLPPEMRRAPLFDFPAQSVAPKALGQREIAAGFG